MVKRNKWGTNQKEIDWGKCDLLGEILLNPLKIL